MKLSQGISVISIFSLLAASALGANNENQIAKTGLTGWLGSPQEQAIGMHIGSPIDLPISSKDAFWLPMNVDLDSPNGIASDLGILDHGPGTNPGSDPSVHPGPNKTPSSPPREYFSLNTLYLNERISIHIGHDLINQNYVVFPSPNVQSIEKLAQGKRKIFFQQYFPKLEPRIVKSYNINPEKLHYLYITGYKVYDQKGRCVDEITIPPGVSYHPPAFYDLTVDSDVKLLTFVFSFVGRTGWSDSGISTDLRGLYTEMRELDIDGSGSIHLETNPGVGVKAYEVLTSDENTKISKILNSLHFIVAWGRMAEREDLISKIGSLKLSEEINIDLSKGVEDLRKYPLVFGDPLDPKWHSVIKKLGSEKLTEREFKTESSGSAKLGLKDFFSFDGSKSAKRESRFKEIIKFDLEGEFYVPKSLKFHIRANHTFTMVNDLVFQAYSHFEEAEYKIGAGVALDEGKPANPNPQPVSVGSNTWSEETKDMAPADFTCAPGWVLGGLSSRVIGRAGSRVSKFECRQLVSQGIPLVQTSCDSPTAMSVASSAAQTSCGTDSFLVGEKSAASRPFGLRGYSHTCCKLGGTDEVSGATLPLKKKACVWSPWLNSFGVPVNYSCPSGTLLSGVKSEPVHPEPRHHHRPLPILDRKFQVECCSFGFDVTN